MNQTASIVSFVADKNRSAEDNLVAIIDYARKDLKGVFEYDNWHDLSWPTGTLPRGRQCKTHWTNIDSTKSTRGEPLQQPFLDFARTYVVMRQTESPTKSQQSRLISLRLLERAQVECQGKADVVSIDNSVFEHTLQLLQDRYNHDPYNTASLLSQIKNFLNEHHLTRDLITWEHSVKSRKHRIISEKRMQREKEKLPPAELFSAMPFLIDIAQKPDAASYDVLPIYLLMLLSCSPARLKEICYNLPADFLWQDPHTGVFYLRWFPAKGGNPVLKMIHPLMTDIVMDVAAKMKEYTDEGRKIALWYEENPTSIYLPDHLEHLRKKTYVSTEEAAQIMGKPRRYISIFIHQLGIKSVAGRGRVLGKYSFKEIEKALLKKYLLPEKFPYLPEQDTIKLKYSEALMTIQLYAISIKNATVPFMFETVSRKQINQKFASDNKNTNIFTRHGFFMADGNILKVGTHSIRHLIDAIRHAIGVNDELRAQQAGRKDPRQNASYEKITEKDVINFAKHHGIVGPLQELAIKTPVSFEKFLQMEFNNVNPTEYGFCTQDFAMSPCSRHGDHLMCSKQWYIKGLMPEKEKRLRRTLEAIGLELKNIEKDKAAGFVVDDRWAENATLKIERLKNLLEILKDPKIPDGALIHLNNKHEVTLLNKRIIKGLLKEGRDADILEEVRKIEETITSLEEKGKEQPKGRFIPELLAPYLENVDENELYAEKGKP